MNFSELLQPGGHMREFMRNAPDGGDWVDGVCDALCLELEKTHLEDFQLEFGAQSANIGVREDGKVQLNVKWSKDRGWSCYTAENFDAAVAQLWAQQHMVNELRKQDVSTGNEVTE